jgi:hypothetical protein
VPADRRCEGDGSLTRGRGCRRTGGGPLPDAAATPGGLPRRGQAGLPPPRARGAYCVRARASATPPRLPRFRCSAPAPLALLWHPNYPFHFHPDGSTHLSSSPCSCMQYHPDVRKEERESDDVGSGVQFQSSRGLTWRIR